MSMKQALPSAPDLHVPCVALRESAHKEEMCATD
jgi:hypothetical protein